MSQPETDPLIVALEELTKAIRDLLGWALAAEGREMNRSLLRTQRESKR